MEKLLWNWDRSIHCVVPCILIIFSSKPENVVTPTCSCLCTDNFSVEQISMCFYLSGSIVWVETCDCDKVFATTWSSLLLHRKPVGRAGPTNSQKQTKSGNRDGAASSGGTRGRNRNRVRFERTRRFTINICDKTTMDIRLIHEFSRARQPLHCSQTNMFKLNQTCFLYTLFHVDMKHSM